MRSIWRMLRSNRGATAIEYGLIASLIAVLTISALTTVGSTIGIEYLGKVSNGLTNAGG